MLTLPLNGAWELYAAGDDAPGAAVPEGAALDGPIPATVPGCVHTDLIAAGRIDDPYYRDNELRLQWISETDWTYRRSFRVPDDVLAHERVILRCRGLDTLATVRLNGQLVGTADNMFRTWEFDAKPLLWAGGNTIEVTLAAPAPYLREKDAQRRLPAWGVGQFRWYDGGWLRKEPCSFGWDWGPILTSSGIWRDIALVAFDTARLIDVHVLQEHATPGRVDVTVRLEAERVSPAPLTATVRLAFGGETVAEATAPLRDAGEGAAHGAVTLPVLEPRLWWPNGMGEQPLYDLTVTLRGDDGATLDVDERRIGLRTLRLDRHADEWGESFQFAVNGVAFFAKGANWIPADTFVTRLTRERYARLLRDAAAANMNMLRVWGGGIYESDDFYELCDELGLCVWQDFIFSCGTYPTFDADFMANVRAEAEDNVRRLRHHASLALWCGNNELEQGLVGDDWTETTMSWDDYSRLFDALLPEVVGRLDPQRDYWPSSPHTPVGDRRDFNNPDAGDAHLWSVWHGKMPFEWYRTCTHRFNSEFGFQSFPEPKTVASYTLPQDRNITSFVMEHHQRSGIGNTTIMTYLLDWFRLPTSFDMALWLSQILQGMAIKYAVEHWRRGMPRGMGTLYWQLNDCWPVASWSSIDSLGRWKALHHMARRFHAPLLVSAVEDAATGALEVHLTNDTGERIVGEVTWEAMAVDGERLDGGTLPAAMSGRATGPIATLDLAPLLRARGPRDVMVWLDLRIDGKVVSSNWASYARPKHLELLDPAITVRMDGVAPDGGHRVTLEAARPALWAWLELAGCEARYSDNFVHLAPGHPAEIVVYPEQSFSPAALRDALRVRSLIDTYRTEDWPT